MSVGNNIIKKKIFKKSEKKNKESVEVCNEKNIISFIKRDVGLLNKFLSSL